MSEAQKIDIQLDIALTLRLVLALMGFMAFSQNQMVVPGFFALGAVCFVVFHMLVDSYVEHKHMYLAAMCTWASATVATAAQGQAIWLTVLFVCLYVYEMFVLSKWGYINA
jgi:hypothetical protein